MNDIEQQQATTAQSGYEEHLLIAQLGNRIRQLVLYIESYGLPLPSSEQGVVNGNVGSNVGTQKAGKKTLYPHAPPKHLTSPSVLEFCNRGD